MARVMSPRISCHDSFSGARRVVVGQRVVRAAAEGRGPELDGRSPDPARRCSRTTASLMSLAHSGYAGEVGGHGEAVLGRGRDGDGLGGGLSHGPHSAPSRPATGDLRHRRGSMRAHPSHVAPRRDAAPLLDLAGREASVVARPQPVQARPRTPGPGRRRPASVNGRAAAVATATTTWTPSRESRTRLVLAGTAGPSSRKRLPTSIWSVRLRLDGPDVAGDEGQATDDEQARLRPRCRRSRAPPREDDGLGDGRQREEGRARSVDPDDEGARRRAGRRSGAGARSRADHGSAPSAVPRRWAKRS